MYILSVSQGKPISEKIKEMRENGIIPLAIIGYDVEGDRFQCVAFACVDPDEVNALLSKIKLSVNFEEK